LIQLNTTISLINRAYIVHTHGWSVVVRTTPDLSVSLPVKHTNTGLPPRHIITTRPSQDQVKLTTIKCKKHWLSFMRQWQSVFQVFVMGNVIRLQSVFHTANRLVFSASRSEHITTLLRDLHWLRVPTPIKLRLYDLAYRCLSGMAPSNLAD